MTGFHACILLALACAAYGVHDVTPYGGLGYHYGGRHVGAHSAYGTYAPTYGVYSAPVYHVPVYHTVSVPVKYVVQTPAVEPKEVTDTYETEPAVPVSVPKTYTTTPVHHAVSVPVKYVVRTPVVESKVTDTSETEPAVPVSVPKTYTTTPVHSTVAVPATKEVTYPTYHPTYYGYGVSPYGLSYGYRVGGYQYVPVLKK
ncbi:uncharacterized protein LOC119160085 [Rhipicephalus microplus]|uniref:uncharacterized protein LOC119160085 n=1 Tax=Rhipicephalus microplus TaxID=6941 RepID=UPI003F6B717E